MFLTMIFGYKQKTLLENFIIYVLLLKLSIPFFSFLVKVKYLIFLKLTYQFQW
jgi:purine-cytosine permease-like protein